MSDYVDERKQEVRDYAESKSRRGEQTPDFPSGWSVSSRGRSGRIKSMSFQAPGDGLEPEDAQAAAEAFSAALE